MDGDKTAAARASRPLSPAQLPIWRAEVLHRKTPRWTQITVVRLNGPVDPDKLEQAIGTVAARHSALRTRLERLKGVASQAFAGADFRLERHWRITAPSEQEAVLAEFISTVQRDNFDLYGGVLFRTYLLKLAEEKFVLVLCLHHIAADGVALGLIVPQIANAYQDEHSDRRPDPAYENWLDRQAVLPPGLEAASMFYQNSLNGAVLHSPVIYDRPDSGDWHEVPDLIEASIILDAVICDALRSLARGQGATLFIVLFAAYAAVLRGFAEQDDLVIATFVSGRAGERVPVIGSCINTVLVRVRLGADDTATALINTVKEAWRPIRRHYAVPSTFLSSTAGGSLPLAQFAINFLDMTEASFDVPGISSSVTHAQQGFPLNDLLLYALREQDGRLRLRLIAGSGTPRLSQARLDEMLRSLVCRLTHWGPVSDA